MKKYLGLIPLIGLAYPPKKINVLTFIATIIQITTVLFITALAS